MSTLNSSSRDLSREPLGRQLATTLRRDIVIGRLEAGTPLVQDQLCTEYDVSRIPVRDALQRLNAEGFVTRNRRNQMVVSEFSEQDLVDTFYLEALLSGVAAGRAAQLGTEEEFARLRRILEEGSDLNPVDDRKRLAGIAWQFHREINQCARSPRLLLALRTVSIHFVQDFVGELPEWWGHSQSEHHEIMNALEARDSETSEKLMFDHLEHAGNSLAEAVMTLRESASNEDRTT